VVGLAVTDHIYANYPKLAEGELAKLRASVVNTAALADRAAELGLGDIMRLGKGEDSSGGRGKESILADGFEAVIGAVHQDGGWAISRDVVLDLLLAEISAGSERPGGQDYKTRLQELTAELRLGPPTYEISATGPDHDREFNAVAVVDGKGFGGGQGTSKKRAEQGAAAAAWHALSEISNSSNGDSEPSEEVGNGQS
jgi:ribonuclease-3